MRFPSLPTHLLALASIPFPPFLLLVQHNHNQNNNRGGRGGERTAASAGGGGAPGGRDEAVEAEEGQGDEANPAGKAQGQ